MLSPPGGLKSAKIIKKKRRDNEVRSSHKSTSITLPVRSQDAKLVNDFNRYEYGTGFLKGNRITVTNQEKAKLLYNYGYFGKGEFSRGAPNSSSSASQNQSETRNEEYSIDAKNLIPISVESYHNRSSWENMAQSRVENQNENFHELFMTNFINEKLKENEKRFERPEKYYKVRYDDRFDDLKFTDESLIKKQTNESGPFCFKIKPIPKFTINEDLILMYEEAFFLSYGLDCLNMVSTKNQQQISLLEMWSLLCEFDRQFPFKYACYHKLRSKGWIVKCGLNGPDHYHASYAVRTVPVDLSKCTANHQHGRDERTNLSGFAQFIQLSSLIRINETVSKSVYGPQLAAMSKSDADFGVTRQAMGSFAE